MISISDPKEFYTYDFYRTTESYSKLSSKDQKTVRFCTLLNGLRLEYYPQPNIYKVLWLEDIKLPRLIDSIHTDYLL